MRHLLMPSTLLLFVLVGAAALLGARQNPAGGAGRTVWDGVFTADQAARGRTQFGAHCAECHGADLQGGQAKALAGERFWIDFQETPLDYLLQQVSANMPFSEDGSLAGTLSAGTYADIVAHILARNGFPAGAQALTSSSSAGVQIVARDGPRELPGGAMAHVVGCLTRGTDGTWRLVNASAPVRALSGRQPDTRRPLGSREYALMFVITRLDRNVGHRMSATGRLMGAGGAEGINVTNIAPVADTCD